MNHNVNCLVDNDYNSNPPGELCAMARIELNCWDSAFAVSTLCPGRQEAIDAARRYRELIDSICDSLVSAAASVVMGFFTVILVAFANLLH